MRGWRVERRRVVQCGYQWQRRSQERHEYVGPCNHTTLCGRSGRARPPASDRRRGAEQTRGRQRLGIAQPRMSHASCPLGLPASPEKLVKFSSADMGELDEHDVAELTKLMSSATRLPNRAFAASLLASCGPPSKVPAPTEGIDSQDAHELQRLLSSAVRPANVHLLSSMLSDGEVLEAQRLLSRCKRPRNRGVLQLAAASACADSCRAALGSAAAAAPAADATPPTPPAPALDMESSVLLVHEPALRDTAHEICQIICGDGGHRRGQALPAPLERSRTFKWRVVNRYYKASLCVAALESTAGEAGGAAASAVRQLAETSQALVLLYDGSDAAGWEQLVARWGEALASGAVAPEILVIVSVTTGGAAARGGAAAAAAASVALEWCLDHGAEFLQCDVAADAAEARELAAAARGERAMPPTSGEAEGLARLVEALQCRVWPPAADDTDASPHQRAASERRELEREMAQEVLAGANGAGAPNGGGTANGGGGGGGGHASPNGTGTGAAAAAAAAAVAGDPARVAEAEEYLAGLAREEQVGAEPPPADPEEEEHEVMEQLLERMVALRDRGGTLTPEERRRKAEQAALELSKMLGEDDGEEEDDN